MWKKNEKLILERYNNYSKKQPKMIRSFPSFILYITSIFLFLSCQEHQTESKTEFQSSIAIQTVNNDFSSDENYTLEKQGHADSIATLLHKDAFYNLQDSGSFQEAISQYQESINIRKDILNKSDHFIDTLLRNKILEGIIRSYNNIGQCYAALGENKKAIEALQICIQRLDEFEETWKQQRFERKAWAYQTLGQVYLKDQDIHTTLRAFQKSIYYSKLENNWGDVADVLNDISWLYIIWREPDSIINYASKALEIYDSLDRQFSFANTEINLGVGYEYKKNYDDARATLLSAHTYFKEDSLKYIEYLSIIHHNLGKLEMLSRNYEVAIKEINLAIEINSNRSRNSRIVQKLGNNYKVKSSIFLELGQLDSAYVYYTKAIQYFLESSSIHLAPDEQISEALLNNSQKMVFNSISILEALHGRIQTLAAMGKREESASRYAKLINLVIHTRQNFNDNASKIQLASIVKKIYEGAISNSYALQDFEQAFAYAEGSKVFTLLEGIRHNKAFEATVNDEDLQKTAQELRERIAQLEMEYSKEKDQAQRIQLSEELKIAQQEQIQLVELLKKDEAYRKMVEDIQPLSVKQIQKAVLAKDQTMIEYFVGENQTYIFTIPKKGTIRVDTVLLSQDTLGKWADALWNGIYFSNKHSQWKELPPAVQEQYTAENFKNHFAEQYANFGFKIYKSLVKPALTHIKKGNRLVIIPDNRLSYTPFDALLQETPQNIKAYHAYKYLANDYHISYCYSATLLHEMRSAKTKNGKGKILAFAPAFAGKNNSYKRLNFGALKYAKKEVEELQSIFGENCVPFFGPEATKDTFLKVIEEQAFDHIHLSTHGKANDHDPNYSFISFTQINPDSVDENQLLYLRDLYTLRLPVKTVVLSACETNQGILKHGEGIMNFTRGLSYAGAQCVLSTLWSVTDKDTKELVVEFYKNLKAGMSKDEALTTAKQSLWENSETLHPYYWAGMIPIGSMEDGTTGMDYRYFALAGILVFILLLLFRRRQQIA